MKLSALLVCLMFAIAPAVAQIPDELEEPKSNTAGLMVGAYVGLVPGFTVTGKDAQAGLAAKLGTAPGFGLQIGYTLRPWLAAFANVDRSDHDSETPLGEDGYSLHHIELGARFFYHLPRRERIVAHGNIGVGARQIYNKRARLDTATGRLILTARELNAGGGVHYFIARNFALDGNLQFGVGHFNKGILPGQPKQKIRTEGVMSTRLRAGIAWYPSDF
ncbi:MAG: outer membrane beta-barrel protein [Gemmatimonadaceae bacterium]